MSDETDETPMGLHIIKKMTMRVGGGARQLPVWAGWPGNVQDYVPEHDRQFRVNDQVKQWLCELGFAISMYHNCMITGPTGAGKTSLVKEYCAISNWPLTRVNFTASMRPEDLLGDVEVVNDNGVPVTRFVDGPIVKAMREGHVLLLDEVDCAPPQLHTTLQRLAERHHNPQEAIDNGRPHVTLALATGEVVKAHKCFRLVATANTVGTGDMTGDYAGTFVMNAAFLDRWGVKVRYTYPDDQEWIDMLVHKVGLDAPMAKDIVEIAQKVNVGKKNASCMVGISPRKTLIWGEMSKAIGNVKVAAELTILNGIDYNSPDHNFVSDVIGQVL